MWCPETGLYSGVDFEVWSGAHLWAKSRSGWGGGCQSGTRAETKVDPSGPSNVELGSLRT